MDTETLVPGNQKMPDLNKLLDLIEEGDADEVLSQENLQNDFSELLKYELVAIKEDKIFLTELGRQAKSIGVQQVIENLNSKNQLPPAAGPVVERRLISRRALYYYLLLVLALMFFLVLQVIWG